MLVYIHIPFCDSKCHYCSFNSYVDKFAWRSRYMHALRRQLQHDVKRFNVRYGEVTSLFFGGGTPSTVDAGEYAPIFEDLQPYLHPDAEITSEANPNSATKTWLAEMKSLGVNRISFGVQSFDAEKLKRLGRAHTPDQAIKAVEHAQTIGYQHLSIDLIYGVVGDTDTLLSDDLNQSFQLPIDHLSAYALTIEEGTPFEKTPHVAQEKLQMTQRFFDKIISHGFRHYEISNFGRHECRHNLGYWRYEPYIGLGCGAVGTVNGIRYYPHRDVEAYVSDPLFITTEAITHSDQITEQIFLGARSYIGIDAKILNQSALKNAQTLCQNGTLTYQNGRYYNHDFLLSDEIALFIES